MSRWQREIFRAGSDTQGESMAGRRTGRWPVERPSGPSPQCEIAVTLYVQRSH
jgi:hypothetical protein